MAEIRHWYLVCYDIRCPKRWRKAYKLLNGYGERVQYSIFRCRLSQRDREKLRWELEKILTADDSLFFAGLCHRCEERVQKCNRAGVWAEDPASFQII
jgi:CRISPR-associated protein Cas2